jgi:PAS domain S-box-containing protein
MSCKYKDGKPEYTRAILRNVTDRIDNEKKINFYIDQLAEREASLRHVIQNAPDAIIVIDREGHILLWNPKAEDVFGWKEEEVKGKQLSPIIIPEQQRKNHDYGMKRYLATHSSNIINRTIEVTALHKKGHEFYVSLTVSHAQQQGRDTFISFLRDITAQKKNEFELENKRKQLEKSNQELEQYAWLTSHDLKEPLRKILTYSSALLTRHAKEVSGTAGSYLTKIHSAANRMNRLIEAVLLYSNVTSDKELFLPTDLNIILKEVIEDLEIPIAAKKANFKINHLPVINAIPIQMRQLFQNLISNAIKYSRPDHAPEIVITCDEIEEAYTITVRDNGIGFENAFAEKIFEVFQRLIINKAYEGTGIGLALCKKILEAHNGTIYAESKPDEGSTFVISLPKTTEAAVILPA